MTFLQKRAIIAAVDLIDDAKKKYSESMIAHIHGGESGRIDSTKISVSANTDIDEAKDWLQAIIDDSEAEEDK